MNRPIYLLFLIAALFTFPQYVFSQRQENYGQYVDPMIGSEGLGRVFIGPSCPFGMVKPSPDCTSRPNSGWLPMPTEVTGFSQVHVSGTGGGPKYGNIQVMPFSGPITQLDQSALRKEEKTTLGYYQTKFEGSNIETEITTAERAAFYRFSYPQTAQKAIKIDAAFFLGESPIPNTREAQQFIGSEIEVLSDREVRGHSRIRGGWNNGKAYTVYFYAVFDHPFDALTSWRDSLLMPNQKSQYDAGKKTGVLLSFKDASYQKLQMKIGISFVSCLKAKENVNTEIPHWDFQRAHTALLAKWEQLLSRIEIDSKASSAQKRMFYTGLYHTMLMPVNRTGENPLWSSEAPYYDDFYAIWDTYRTSNPLITLISPQREVDIINSLIDIYKQDGYMPDARSGNSNGRTQGGSNAEVLIADAYVKGLKGINYQEGLQAMLKDALVPPGGNEEQEGRGGLVEYNRLGYVPYGIDRAGNRTVEYSYNDYNIATVAKGLGEEEVYNRFIKQSANWKNLWRDDYENNGAKGFIMPRDANGNWLDEIPFGSSKVYSPTFLYHPLISEAPWYLPWWSAFLYEGTSWEYSLSIPQDVPGLIEKSGGKEAFQKRLNIFFDRSYYNVNNEPSFLTPCLYHWIGKPYLSSDRIHQIISTHFNDSNVGLPGNDDSGAMSSWLAFHMLGLYPNAGQGYYLLNTPFLKESVIHLDNGNSFKISAQQLSDKKRYVGKALLNGKQLNRAWISHDELMKGGELVLEMVAKPTKWGARELPPQQLK